MKAIQPIIATAVLIFGMVTCSGWAEDSPVVLTPTKLYEMIHSANVLNYQRNKKFEDRLGLIERFLGDADTQGAMNNTLEKFDYRIKELERKVAGLQRAIKLLYGSRK